MKLHEEWEQTFDSLGFPKIVLNYLWAIRNKFGTDNEIKIQVMSGHARKVAIKTQPDIEGLKLEAERYFREIN